MHKVLVCALFMFACPAFAEDSENTGSLTTNVIGSQEAPTVMNVVPWKDKDVKLEKQDPTSSLLNRVLEPLDQEVLMREVDYYRILNEESGDEGMFLE